MTTPQEHQRRSTVQALVRVLQHDMPDISTEDMAEAILAELARLGVFVLPEPEEGLDLYGIMSRLKEASAGIWNFHEFGLPGEDEPSSIVIHKGKFEWEAIRHGEADVIAWLDREAYYDAIFITQARQDIANLIQQHVRNKATVAQLQKDNAALQDSVNATRSLALQAEQEKAMSRTALTAVRKLHQPNILINSDDRVICQHDGSEYPCSTIRLIDLLDPQQEESAS